MIKKLKLYFRNKREQKQKKRDAEIKYKTDLANIKETTRINHNEFISDLRYFKPTFWNRVFNRISPSKMCMVVLHYPDNIDTVRYYPMPKPFMVNINKKYYLFTPKALPPMT